MKKAQMNGIQKHSSSNLKLWQNAYVNRLVDQAMGKDARAFNRKQRVGNSRGLISISMAMRHIPGVVPPVIAAQASEVLRQEFKCEECSCRYASVGSSFFCPACGHNSAESSFDRTIEVVRGTLDYLPTLREGLSQSQNSDLAKDTERQLVQDQFSRLVGAFERFK